MEFNATISRLLCLLCCVCCRGRYQDHRVPFSSSIISGICHITALLSRRSMVCTSLRFAVDLRPCCRSFLDAAHVVKCSQT